ncbi:NTP transferase domain-containing protein [bacterium]|nr:NTP transferase domain-containing protein [bacterium]
MRFAAILLAAGQSTRMGTPKALLPWGGATFFEEAALAVEAVAPLHAILVTNPMLAPRLSGRWKGQLVVNPDSGSSQFDSLCLGLRAIPPNSVNGAFILLVDNPGWLGERLRRLAEAASADPTELLAAAFRGEIGHPLWLPVAHWAAVLEWSGRGGLRGWMVASGKLPRPVEVDSSTALSDIDTPASLEAFRHAMEQQQ